MADTDTLEKEKAPTTRGRRKGSRNPDTVERDDRVRSELEARGGHATKKELAEALDVKESLVSMSLYRLKVAEEVRFEHGSGWTLA